MNAGYQPPQPPCGEGILLEMAARYLDRLRRIVDGVRQPLCVIVHQFSHTPLYAPAYLALEALRTACAEDGVSWLRLDYHATYSDQETLAAVVAAGGRRADGCLYLGLSEVAPGDPARDVISKPFVKRLPLWGVALLNNPRINGIRKALSQQQRDFGRLFRGKLSVLQPEHFRAAEAVGTIGFSIYEKGSTAYRLFMGMLTPEEEPRCRIVQEDDDFGPLLRGEVDVALTVQPWRGMRLAQQQHMELDMVYTHMSRPEPISSIYMLRDPAESVDLSRHFIDVLGALVQYHVGQLYAGQGIDNAYRSYARAGGGEPGMEDVAVFALAMQLLADSRVYFHELADDTSRHTALAQRLAQSIACHFDTGNERDPVYVMSIHVVNFQDRGLNWHRSAPDDRLDNLLARHGMPGVGKAFGEFVSGFQVGIDHTDTPHARKEAWRLSDPQTLFPQHPFRIEDKTQLEYNPWRILLDRERRVLDPAKAQRNPQPGSVQVEFCPWMHAEIRRRVFDHLNAQFAMDSLARRLRPGRMRSGVVLIAAAHGDSQTPANYEGLSWFWIEYNSHSPRATPPNQFMRTPEGMAYLNMWSVNERDRPTVSAVFVRAGHGACKLAANGRVTLEAGQQQCTVVDRMEGHHGLLFTFRVKGLVC